MFVLTPHPCVLVCVRVCVRASSVNRVNCIGHYPSREPAQKRSRLCCFLPQPRVQEHNSEHERWDSRLLLFELYKQANCEAKRPFFSFFYFFFCIVVSYTRILCTTVYWYLHQFIQFKIYAHARLRRSQKVPGIELCSVRPTGGPTFPGFAC